MRGDDERALTHKYNAFIQIDGSIELNKASSELTRF